MPTEYPSLDQCERCGKLFHREATRTLCHACAGITPPPADPPIFTEEDGLITEAQRRFLELMETYEKHMEPGGPGLVMPKAEQRRLLHGSESAEADPPATGCTLCGQPRIENSDFCLGCQSHLYRSLGDAASELFTRLEAVESAPGRISSVLSALEDARSRTAMSRINPVATRRLRT